MCKFYRKLKIATLTLALIVATGQALFGAYTQDPPSCSGTAIGLAINTYACDNSTVASCTHIISGAGTVIAGEFIAYQATLSLPSNCAYALGTAGTFTLQLPNSTIVNLALQSGTCNTLGGPVSCTIASNAVTGACIGCTVAQTGASGDFPIAATTYTTSKQIYQVAQADFVPPGCIPGQTCFVTAKTTYGGTGIVGNGIAFTSSSPSPGPQAQPSTPNAAAVCEAKIDKQVNCGGGFVDVTGVDDTAGTTNGCTALFGANVTTQFIAKNTGGAAISCTLGDNVLTVPPGSTAVSLPSLNNTSTATIGPFACNLSGSASGTNTATLNLCTCTTAEGVIVSGPDSTDTATYSCCGVQFDKQVSCDNGTTFKDVCLPTATDDTTNCANTLSCTGTTGLASVVVQYVAKNVGNVDVSGCTISDSNGAVLTAPIAAGGIVKGTVTNPVRSSATALTCSDTLTANEPNTGSISCACPVSGTQGPLSATASDTASIQCQPPAVPRIEVSKLCPLADANGNTTANITVKNTSDPGVTFSNCQLTDTLYTNGTTAVTCPATGTPSGTPSTVTVSPNPIPTLNQGAQASSTGTITGLLAAACNTVSVTCNTTTTPATITGTTQVSCPIPSSCFTRTPGYWGTHPSQTSTVIGGGLAVCGHNVVNVSVGVAGSAIEDLCESNIDARSGTSGNATYTSPQQLQLIRQCTAAALNLRVSGGGVLASGLTSCESAAGGAGITSTYNSCCDELGASTCNGGLIGNSIDVTGCITRLDAFNNKFDNVPFPSGSGLTNSSADSRSCTQATGNRLTNCSSDGLGGTILCGPGSN